MKKEKIAIVIPTIRSLEFLEQWKDEFKDAIGIIVEDHQHQEIDTPLHSFSKIYHYTWEHIDKELGKDSWIIPRKAAAIRSFGFLKAYQLGVENVITLDDDCFPYEENFVKKHIDSLTRLVPSRWYPTNPFPGYWFTRGFPYGEVREQREVLVNHGIWVNNLDFDAPTHLMHLGKSFNHELTFSYPIPVNYYFPWCIMNVSFKRIFTPLSYLLLMGHDPKGAFWGFERFDDIWAGIFMKKILDHLGFAVLSGSPIVEHKRASNPFKNLQMEARGIQYNEELWKRVDEVKLTKDTIVSSYKQLIQKVKLPNEEYFTHLKKAILIWLEHFS